jgi:hypothetical protein
MRFFMNNASTIILLHVLQIIDETKRRWIDNLGELSLMGIQLTDDFVDVIMSLPG